MGKGIQTASKTESGFGSIKLPSDTNNISEIIAAALFGVTGVGDVSRIASESKKGSGGIAGTLQQMVLGSEQTYGMLSEMRNQFDNTSSNLNTLSENIMQVDSSLSQLGLLVDITKAISSVALTLPIMNNNISDGFKNVVDPIKETTLAIENSKDTHSSNEITGGISNISVDTKELTNQVKEMVISNKNILDTISRIPNYLQVIGEFVSISSANSIEQSKVLAGMVKDVNTFKNSMMRYIATLQGGDKGGDSSGIVRMIVEGIDKGTVKEIRKLAEIKIGKDSFLSKDQLDKLIENYKKIEELFKLQTTVANNAKQAQKANRIIKDTFDSTDEAIGAANRSKGASAAIKNLADIGSFILKAGLVLMIGALFMMIPGMFKNALKFTAALTVFITAILVPFFLISKFGGKSDVLKNLESVKSLVVACSFIMTVGALFMMLGGGKMVEGALKFGGVLALFLLAVLTPIALYSKLAKNAVKSLDEIKRLIVAAAFVMLIGAGFMMLGGGKFAYNALMFGLLLMSFVTLLLVPVIFYSVISRRAAKTIDELQGFIVTCAILMLVGALITMDFNLMVRILAFGFLLATFIGLVLAPIMLFNTLSRKAHKSLVGLTALIIVSTIIMFVGAYFISDFETVVRVLAFTMLLALFITGVTAPMLLLKGLDSAYKNMLALTLLVAVSAGAMWLGAWLIDEYGWKPALFAGLIVAFIGGILLAFKLLVKDAATVEAASKAMITLAISIGLLTAALALICLLIDNYDLEQVLSAVGILAAIMGGLIVMYRAIGSSKKIVDKGADVLMAIGVSLLLFTVALGLIVFMSDVYGWDTVMSGIVALTGIVALFSGMYIALGAIGKTIETGADVIKAIGISLLILAGTLFLIVWMGDEYGWGTVFAGIGALATIAVLFGVLYWGLASVGAGIAAGAVVLLALAGSLLIMSGALFMIVWMGEEYGWGDVFIGVGALAAITLIFGLLYWGLAAIGGGVAAGAAVLIALSASLVIMSAALGIFCEMNERYKPGDLAGQPMWDLMGFWGQMGLLFLELLVVGAAAIIGLVGLALISPTIWGVIAITREMSIAMAAFKEVKDLNVSDIKDKISDFLTITDCAPSPLDYLDKKGKLHLLSSLSSSIAYIVRRISTAVADMANLRVATEWNDAGIPIKYRQLSSSDFRLAAENVSLVFTTLGQAIFDTYTNNPKLFESDKFYSILFKVQFLASTEADLISKISNSIKDYAVLKIATHWDKDGNPTKYRLMTETDFAHAAKGVGTVLTTLGAAINKVYTDNKDNLFGDDMRSILNSVSKLAVTEGEMLSIMAEGLKSYAMIMIPTKWNSRGVATHYEQMTDQQFISAGQNIGTVLTFLTRTLIGLYDGGTIDFTVNGRTVSVDGGTGMKDKIEQVGLIAQALTPVGEIVGGLATGLAQYAELKFASAWDASGKPIEYAKLDENTFAQVGVNVAKVVTALSNAIIQAYKQNPGLFADQVVYDVVEENGFFGIGGSTTRTARHIPNSSPFYVAINAIQGMGPLIGSLAQGVAVFAGTRVATEWNDKGVATKYDNLTNVINRAQSHITELLSALGTAIVSVGTGKSAKDLKTANEVIVPMLQSSTKIVQDMAASLQSYAELRIPIYDSNGKLTGYKQMDSTVMTEASKNITSVLLTMLYGKLDDNDITKFLETSSEDRAKAAKGGIIGVYSMLKKDNLENRIKDVAESLIPISELISNMATSIAQYAELKYPSRWNADGKPISFNKLTGEMMSDATKNILSVLYITLFGVDKDGNVNMENPVGGIIGAYDTLKKKDYHNELETVVESLLPVTEFISGMAESISNFAKLQIPNKWNDEGKPIGYMKLSGNDFKNATKNIETVLISTVKSIIEIYNENKELFDLTGDGENANTPIGIAINSVLKIGEVIKNIAEGIKEFADGGIPVYNYEGKIIKRTPFKDSYIKDMNANIKTIVTGMADAVITAGNSITLEGEDFEKIVDVISKISGTIKSVVETTQAYAELKIPTGYYSDGSPKGYTMFNKEKASTAKENIKAIIVNLIEAICEANDSNVIVNGSTVSIGDFVNREASSILDPIDTTLTSICSIVGQIASIIGKISEFRFPTGFNSDGTPSGYVFFNPKKHGEKIKSTLIEIIGSLPAAISEAYEVNKSYFGETANTAYNEIQTSLNVISDVIKEIMSPVNQFIEGSEPLKKFLNYKALYKGDTGDITLGACKDIYGVIMEIGKTFNTLSTTIAVYSRDAVVINETLSNFESVIDILSPILSNINSNLIGSGKQLSSVFSYSRKGGIKQEGFNTLVMSDIYTLLMDVEKFSLLTGGSFENASETAYAMSMIASSLDEFMNVIDSIQYNQDVKKLSKDIEEFVNKSINVLDVNKIDRLISLTQSLNNLADKTTNLDALTNAIADNLASVLGELVKRMDEASRTIKLSDRMQDNRRQQITESIKEIKSLMDRNMQINITVEDKNAKNNNSPGGTTNNGNNTGNINHNAAELVERNGGNNTSKQDEIKQIKQQIEDLQSQLQMLMNGKKPKR